MHGSNVERSVSTMAISFKHCYFIGSRGTAIAIQSVSLDNFQLKNYIKQSDA